MTDATIEKLRDFALDLLRLSDIDAAILHLFDNCHALTASSDELARIAMPNGNADALLDRMQDPAAARQYCREVARRFAPYAEVLRAVLPRGRWTQSKGPSKRGNGNRPRKFNGGNAHLTASG